MNPIIMHIIHIKRWDLITHSIVSIKKISTCVDQNSLKDFREHLIESHNKFELQFVTRKSARCAQKNYGWALWEKSFLRFLNVLITCSLLIHFFCPRAESKIAQWKSFNPKTTSQCEEHWRLCAYFTYKVHEFFFLVFDKHRQVLHCFVVSHCQTAGLINF